MADIKTKYPSSSTTALTISLASLANSSGLTTGRESAAVDNTTNLDLDHLVSGKIRAGTSPTSGNRIEVWAYAPISVSSGTPTYPAIATSDGIDGTDSAVTALSDNVKFSALRLIASITVDSTSDRDYFIPPTSIASLFGGQMPTHWGVIVFNGSGVALNSTAGNHDISYLRKQAQTV